MKKFLTILLVPVFLLMTTGVIITSLYCNGQISYVGIAVKDCCKDVNKGGCCHTESKLIKVEDSFVGASASFDLVKIINLNFNNFEFFYEPELISTSYLKTYWDKVPPSKDTPRYILFHSLII